MKEGAREGGEDVEGGAMGRWLWLTGVLRAFQLGSARDG